MLRPPLGADLHVPGASQVGQRRLLFHASRKSKKVGGDGSTGILRNAGFVSPWQVNISGEKVQNPFPLDMLTRRW
jgi:hypothetical protein